MRRRHLTKAFERFRDHGDGAALALVFDALAADLMRVARFLVRSASEAEDVVQSTFLIAIEKRQAFRDSGTIEAWLHGILVREAARARRRIARVQPLTAAGEQGLPARDPEPDAACDHADDAAAIGARVGGALGDLPPHYREVLEPLLLGEADVAAIARSVGRSPATVRSQIHRGLERLRRKLPAGVAPAWAAAPLAWDPLALRARVLRSAAEAAASNSTALASSAAGAAHVAVRIGLAKATAVAAGVTLCGAAAWVSRDAWTARRAPEVALAARPAAAPAGLEPLERAGDPASESNGSTGVAALRTALPPPPSPPQRTAEGAADLVPHWRARFAEEPESWRHGLAVAEELARVEPERGVDVLKALWPELSLAAREQVLKPFVFEPAHPRALELVETALGDPATSVQDRGLSYLEAYAFRDFHDDWSAALQWIVSQHGRPLARVFEDSAAQCVQRLLALAPEQRAAEMLALSLDVRSARRAGVDAPAVMRAAGAEKLLALAVRSEDARVARRALEWSRTLEVDASWLHAYALPFLADADPARAGAVDGLVEAALEALARPDCEWARAALWAYLERVLASPPAGPGSAAGESNGNADVMGDGRGLRPAARALIATGERDVVARLVERAMGDGSNVCAERLGRACLQELTGVSYHESHDAAWWREWWRKNGARFDSGG